MPAAQVDENRNAMSTRANRHILASFKDRLGPQMRIGGKMKHEANSDLLAWRDAPAMFDIMSPELNGLVEFVEGCTKDDLTAFTTIHGVEAELPLFKAILSHPELDRATALTIFHACNPSFYEMELANGTAHDTLALDREDEIFIEILDLAHERLTKGDAMTSSFSAPCLEEWYRFPHVSPKNFRRWTLEEHHLLPTRGLTPRPCLLYTSDAADD